MYPGPRDDSLDDLLSDDPIPGVASAAGDLPISAVIGGEVKRTTVIVPFAYVASTLAGRPAVETVVVTFAIDVVMFEAVIVAWPAASVSLPQ